jgi:hypothetical protein
MSDPLRAALARQLTDLAATLDGIRDTLRADVPVPTLARTLTELEDAGELLAATAERLEEYDPPLVSGAP